MLADLGKALGFKGYTVEIIQGETEIDKHVEKADKINRGGGAVLLAVEVIPSEKSRVMVAAATEAPKGEGRFLSITEISSRFSQESGRLAACLAAPFETKVTHLPLFPLLGVSMPGVALRLELKTGDNDQAVSKITEGIEKYFSERTGK